jgi:UDP-N-acetylmuramate--alanine ligase
MSKENLVTNAKNIHFVGVGGIGMSALANICHKLKIRITGSDLDSNNQILELEKLNIKISLKQVAENIQDQDLVIHSLAIPKENPELIEAHKIGIKVLSYPQALGEITKSYKLIAIAGSHGKTTCTGMLAKILIDKGLDPTIIIGSTANFLDNQNYRLGNSEYFILEACEYYAGFLNLNPFITLITNLEHDHFDAYPTENSYLDAFQELVNKSDNVVLNTDFPLSTKIEPDPKIIEFKASSDRIKLGIPGIHNQTNAQGVLKVCQLLEIHEPQEPLAQFTGTGRRLQIVKQTDEQIVYDDYGHHPTEIQATLQAIKEKHPNQKICLIYQAHQHNRTIALLKEFKQAFADFDKVIIPDIYAARDSKEEQSNMTAQKFANEINGTYSESLEKTGQSFSELTQGFPIVVIMGAGNIYAKLKAYL